MIVDVLGQQGSLWCVLGRVDLEVLGLLQCLERLQFDAHWCQNFEGLDS